jgi:hypothetical protein
MAAGSRLSTMRRMGVAMAARTNTALRAVRDATSREHLVLTDGTTVRLDESSGAEVLSIHDAGGRLIIEHRPAEGRTIVGAPAGNLELRADHGSITLAARDAVRVEARRADVTLDEANLVARSVTTVTQRARHVAEVLEVQAGRILEKAKSVYRDVEDLAQTRAGRMRLVADATFHLLGKRTLFKAEEDMKLKGKKIHLA